MNMEILPALILGTLAVAAYFLPTIVAIGHKQPNAQAIFVLNLFLGWTFLGWVIALIWAAVKPKNGA